MKNCKWLIYFVILLFYVFIVFRYIQKWPAEDKTQTISEKTSPALQEEQKLENKLDENK